MMNGSCIFDDVQRRSEKRIFIFKTSPIQSGQPALPCLRLEGIGFITGGVLVNSARKFQPKAYGLLMCVSITLGAFFGISILAHFSFNFWLVQQKVSLRNSQSFDQLPVAATQIYAEGNGLVLYSEFKIPQVAIRNWSSKKGWRLEEITEPIRVQQYGSGLQGGDEPFETTVTDGIFYRRRFTGGRFIEAVFNRSSEKGYYNYARR
jgi:hypothetical protein